MKNIRINIPHTLALFDEKFYLKTNDEGCITWTNIFKENHVLDRIIEIAKIEYDKDIKSDIPAVIFKHQEFNDVSNWETFRDDMGSNKLRSGGIVQQYVYPFGGKAWIVRFVYYNPVCNLENNLSFSMNAANKLKIDMKELNIKYSLQRRSSFMMEIRNSFDLYISKKGGANQRQYENIAQTLISLVMKVYKIRISKIVIDFIQDENK